jgi:glycosyltransferase involved in cell wall biosynthesis
MAERGRALIILPTYNEVENIAAVIAGIRRATQETGPFDILVVDDGSPDGTAAAVRDLQTEDSHLHLLERGSKLGLGTAYRAGFEFATEHGHEFAFTMDADLSHNPEHVPHLWLQTERADVVIGSRYIPGGGIVNWPWHRRQLSATANFLARVILGLGARDCTSGFRCYRVETLGRVGLDRIRSSGYSYLTELLFRCQEAGARIREVPIKFVDRQRGKSKISKTEIWKAMLTLLRLRRGRGRQRDD